MGAESHRPRPALNAPEEWRSPAGWPKSEPPICNTNGWPPRSSEQVARIASITKVNLQCLQILEEGRAMSASQTAQGTLGGIVAEADTADIDLKPAWIDTRDVAAQPRVINEHCPRHRVIRFINTEQSGEAEHHLVPAGSFIEHQMVNRVYERTVRGGQRRSNRHSSTGCCRVFLRLVNLQGFDQPIVPEFAVKQYWHRRFHHDARVIWLRTMMSEFYQNN
jgi:hypothetical protein